MRNELRAVGLFSVHDLAGLQIDYLVTPTAQGERLVGRISRANEVIPSPTGIVVFKAESSKAFHLARIS